MPSLLRPRPGRAVLLLLAVLLAAPVAHGMQLAISRQRLCQAADFVAVAEVTSAEVLWTEGAVGGLQTRTWLATDAAVRGDAPDTLELVMPGGRIGELEQHVEHAPRFELDRRYLVFLRAGSDGAMSPLGGEQGVVLLGQGGEDEAAALATLGACGAR
jgi:hypothetical protein